jgi:uncharacterized protein (TIGR02246 family)
MTNLQLAGAAMTVLMAACLGACNKAAPAQPAVDTAKDTEVVKALEDQAVAAANSHQYDKFAALYASDGAFFFAGAPAANGPDAIGKSFATFANDKAYNFKLTIDRIEVAKSGEVAYALWGYDQTSTNPKTHAVVHEIGNGLDTLRKGADGTWKFVDSFQTPSGPPAPAAKP